MGVDEVERNTRSLRGGYRRINTLLMELLPTEQIAPSWGDEVG